MVVHLNEKVDKWPQVTIDNYSYMMRGTTIKQVFTITVMLRLQDLRRSSLNRLNNSGRVTCCHVISYNFFQKKMLVVCAQKIYYAVVKIKKNRMQGRNTVEEVLCLSVKRGYTVFYRSWEESNVLSDIVIVHPTSIAMIRTWPYVLIMDTTVWTSEVLHFAVEITNRAECELSVLKIWLSTYHGDLDIVFLNVDFVIKSQIAEIKNSLESSKLKEKFNLKDVSVFWRTLEIGVNVPSAHARDMESEMRDLTSMSDKISTGSISKVRECCCLMKGILCPVLHEDPCAPLTSPQFIYEFIYNRKNVVGHGNYGFKVVANFLFRDENHWPEVRRQMTFDLQLHLNVYLQLFGSLDRVYRYIQRTQWFDGPAPEEYWLEIHDQLNVIANIFNFCVLQLWDTCPLPPLNVQWEYHRHIQLSGWKEPYSVRIADSVRRQRPLVLLGDPIYVEVD
ncbi:hypothetical protein M9H77_23134 [Catharanthus roseus]|uniref:Uncharacterized protein n=1 Tax=Catharanthus roseus TaxID=4058 RepID=A0ACC0AWG7_CATRO|nr:hypothetical protein M9H77_23134 [Catharanthus roseus]